VLRRVRRINRGYPQAVENAGVEEVFVDLTYSTGGVDEALEVAAGLL
jgi:hypothetical protein